MNSHGPESLIRSIYAQVHPPCPSPHRQGRSCRQVADRRRSGAEPSLAPCQSAIIPAAERHTGRRPLATRRSCRSRSGTGTSGKDSEKDITKNFIVNVQLCPFPPFIFQNKVGTSSCSVVVFPLRNHSLQSLTSRYLKGSRPKTPV